MPYNQNRRPMPTLIPTRRFREQQEQQQQAPPAPQPQQQQPQQQMQAPPPPMNAMDARRAAGAQIAADRMMQRHSQRMAANAVAPQRFQLADQVQRGLAAGQDVSGLRQQIGQINQGIGQGMTPQQFQMMNQQVQQGQLGLDRASIENQNLQNLQPHEQAMEQIRTDGQIGAGSVAAQYTANAHMHAADQGLAGTRDTNRANRNIAQIRADAPFAVPMGGGVSAGGQMIQPPSAPPAPTSPSPNPFQLFRGSPGNSLTGEASVPDVIFDPNTGRVVDPTSVGQQGGLPPGVTEEDLAAVAAQMGISIDQARQLLNG